MNPDRSLLSQRFRFAAGCYFLLAATLCLLTVFVYLPVAWALMKSLYQFEVGSEARFVGLANYREFLALDPITWVSFLNMGVLTLFAVVVRLTFPLVVAKLIHSLPSERWRYFYRLVFIAPMVVPGVAVQLIWVSVIYGDHGVLNELLRAAGLDNWCTGWLSNPRTALPAVAMVGFPFAGGFEVLVYYAGLDGIPESVNEAARIEGCGGLRKFFLIEIPMILSQLKLILLLTVIAGIQGFENILILTRGGPGFSTTVPGLWMYFNAFSFQRMGYACAVGVCLFVWIFTLTALNMRYFKSSEQIQGIG